MNPDQISFKGQNESSNLSQFYLQYRLPKKKEWKGLAVKSTDSIMPDSR